jgi:hemerythrin-like domain-containing protein
MAEQTHLEAVRLRRETLHQALVGLEDALATPIGDAAHWRLRVAMAVDHAANRIDDHIRQTEAPTGLLQRVIQEEPRLSCRAERLRVEHGDIRRSVEQLQRTLNRLDEAEVQDRGGAIRTEALELMGQLVRHRQRGADLIYEAYQVDLGSS